MAKVNFPDHLLGHTAGRRQLEISASSYRDLVSKLEEVFPGIEQILLSRVAVAIDGEIIHDPLLEAIGADSEIHFLPRLEGG